MNEDKRQSEREIRENEAASGPEAGPVPDPIARNPKDIAASDAEVQAAEVHRRTGVPASGEPTALGWPMAGRPVQVPSSPAEFLLPLVHCKWTLLAVTILVSAPLIALIWTQTVPKYQARAEIRVRPIIPRLVFRTEDTGPIPFYDSFVNTQVSIIRSGKVLQRVLEKPEVQETQWYNNPPRTLLDRLRGKPVSDPERLERLRDSLSARPRPRTELIDVSFRAINADEAMLILGKVVDEYTSHVKEQDDVEGKALNKELARQYEDLRLSIAGKQSKYATECEKLGVSAPQELVSAQRLRLDEARARLSELQLEIKLLEIQRAAIPTDSNEAPEGGASQIEKQSKYYEDAEWRQLDLDVKRLQHQITYSIQGPNHPGWKRATKDLEVAEGLRKEWEAQLDTQWQERRKDAAAGSLATGVSDRPGVTEAVLTVEYQLARARQKEKVLTDDLTTQKTNFEEAFKNAQNLEILSNDLQQTRELFDAVRQRKEQKDMESNESKNAVVAVIEKHASAYSPARPQEDRRVVFSIMALALGLGTGGGAAFLRSIKTQAIYAAKDIPQPAQTPFLGSVPLVRLSKPLGHALCHEIKQKQFNLVEAVRMLRTTLLSRLEGHSKVTMLVTSACEGTGKSSVTLVLGRSLAQSGRKVLIVDADLHKMTLSKRLDLSDKPGLQESLQDKTSGSLHVFPSDTPGLEVLPAGKYNSNYVAFEELANGTFKGCLGRLFEQHGYDIILLDAPPLLSVADAVILAGQVDGAILVEREHVSRRTEVASALLRLESAGGHLLGTIFVGSADHDYYGYRYRYGHYGRKTRGS